MADAKLAYGTVTAVAITLASLASSATAGREATEIDNTTNLFMDAELFVQIELQAGSPANDKAVYIYGAASLDGVDWPDAVTGTDAAITLNNPANLPLIGVINAPTSAGIFKRVFKLAPAFGGSLPPFWLPVIRNYTGIAFSATEGDHAVEYRGIYQTIA